MTKLRSALILALFISLALGCGKKEGTAKADPEMEAAIKGYCAALIPTYNALNTKPLEGYASEKEIGRINMILMQFTGEKKFMESEMKDFRVVKVSVKDDSHADVETVEKWRFRHLRQVTLEVIKPWINADYKLMYHLTKQDGRWLVDKTEFLK